MQASLEMLSAKVIISQVESLSCKPALIQSFQKQEPKDSASHSSSKMDFEARLKGSISASKLKIKLAKSLANCALASPAEKQLSYGE